VGTPHPSKQSEPEERQKQGLSKLRDRQILDKIQPVSGPRKQASSESYLSLSTGEFTQASQSSSLAPLRIAARDLRGSELYIYGLTAANLDRDSVVTRM
jgi:hypothetical protein